MVNYRILISAIITAIAYQSMGWLTCVSLIPMLSQPINAKSLGIWGLIYMGILHWFIIGVQTTSNIPVAVLLWAIATGYYALFYAIGGAIIKQQSTRHFATITLPILWGLIEWCKSNAWFPNPLGNLGYATSNMASIIHSYEIIGPYGVSVLLIGINILIYKWWKTKHWQYALGVLIILASSQLKMPATDPPQSLSVSVIQTGTPQLKKLNRMHWPAIKATILDQITTAKGALVVTPETIIPTSVASKDFLSFLTI